jgi:hypothetical protein
LNISINDSLIKLAIISASLTFLVFSISLGNDFVALDDYAYIVNNSHIEVFNWNTVFWALTSFHEGNWHPLTMISLAVDRSLWGLQPAGFHFVNVLIHCATVLSACYLFYYLLRAVVSSHHKTSPEVCCSDTVDSPSSAFTERILFAGSIAGALFFGLHPLRVESVVWASERKDVLCLFFLTTSLVMYIRYVRMHVISPETPFWCCHEYLCALILAILAQASKPTAVSLPLLLCIIDWYPLQIITDKRSLFRSLKNKIPFFVLAVIGVILTISAQQVAINNSPSISLMSRLLIACKALLFYIAATVYPSGLNAFYIHPGEVSSSTLVGYMFIAILVVSITITVVRVRRLHPQWMALWFMYCISLLPMLGLIQVGGQWVADRYSYLPSLGISLLWGGGLMHLYVTLRQERRPLANILLICAASQLILLTVITVRQISVWKNTETLATRIIDTQPHLSGSPYLARAIYRNRAGRYNEALDDSNEALKIALRGRFTRTYLQTACVQADVLKNMGRFSESLAILDWGIDTSIDPLTSDVIQLRSELVRKINADHQ